MTFLLFLLAAGTSWWFYQDHEVWIVERTFPNTTSSLAGHVSQDGTKLLAGSENSSFYLISPFVVWNVSTGEQVCSFGAPPEFAEYSMFSPDGTQILTVGGAMHITRDGNGGSKTVFGDLTKTVRLWDSTTGKRIANLDPVGQLQSNFGNVPPFAFSPDGKRIITLEIDSAKLYDREGRKLGVLAGSDRPAGYSFITDRAYFSPDSTRCVIRTVGQFPVRVRSTSDGSLIAEHTLENGTSNGFDGVFSPDGKTFACVCFGWVYLIDSSTGSLHSPPIRVPGQDEGICFSPDGADLLVLTNNFVKALMTESLVMIDSSVGKVVATTPLASPGGGQSRWIAHGKLLAISSWTDRVEFIGATDLKPIRSIAAHGVSRFSGDCDRFICKAADSRNLDLFSVNPWQFTSEIIADSPAQVGWFSDAKFLPDPKQLLTATDRGITQKWIRRRPESAWGVFALPQCWIAVVFSVAFLFGLWWDVVRFYRKH